MSRVPPGRSTLRSPDHRRVGPFVVRYNPDWSIPPANYAIPDQGADPDARGHRRARRRRSASAIAYRASSFCRPAPPRSNPPCWRPGSPWRTGRRSSRCAPGGLARRRSRWTGSRSSNRPTTPSTTPRPECSISRTGRRAGPTEGEITWLRTAAGGRRGRGARRRRQGRHPGRRGRLLGPGRRADRALRPRGRLLTPPPGHRRGALRLPHRRRVRPWLPGRLAGAGRCGHRADLRGDRLPAGRREGRHVTPVGRWG